MGNYLKFYIFNSLSERNILFHSQKVNGTSKVKSTILQIENFYDFRPLICWNLHLLQSYSYISATQILHNQFGTVLFIYLMLCKHFMKIVIWTANGKWDGDYGKGGSIFESVPWSLNASDLNANTAEILLKTKMGFDHLAIPRKHPKYLF